MKMTGKGGLMKLGMHLFHLGEFDGARDFNKIQLEGRLQVILQVTSVLLSRKLVNIVTCSCV